MKVIRVSQTNLFRVAQEQLGDSSQWSRIARANKRYDLIIEEPTDLLIPEKNQNAFKGAGV